MNLQRSNCKTAAIKCVTILQKHYMILQDDSTKLRVHKNDKI